jgi:2-C-methyl-D-erythritol 2,4-cyclodiphosphate synthase
MTTSAAALRIGQGYDVHAFGEGDHVMLGGVRVPHVQGVLAHSDGDVVVHALCDALLGALALGDIGQHFRLRMRVGKAPTAWLSCAIARH